MSAEQWQGLMNQNAEFLRTMMQGLMQQQQEQLRVLIEGLRHDTSGAATRQGGALAGKTFQGSGLLR